MNKKAFILGFIAYPLMIFPLAIIWHLFLFKTSYESFNYISRAEPGFALGLLSMFFQGAMLSYIYPKVSLSGAWISRGLKFGFLFGVFFWSCHVIATAAKHAINHMELFIVMESIYMAIQFLGYCCVLAFIYEVTKVKEASSS